jgi:hypothetical protein
MGRRELKRSGFAAEPLGFVSAFFQIQHERGVAILFIVSVAAFIVSLADFAREVRVALSEFDQHG